MQFHAGNIPTGSDGNSRILMRITHDKNSTYYGFPIGKTYTSRSQMPDDYLERTNALLLYIGQQDLALCDTLWTFYHTAHDLITHSTRANGHRISHQLGNDLYDIFSDVPAQTVLFDFIDSYYSEREYAKDDALIAFQCIVSLMVPVLGFLAERVGVKSPDVIAGIVLPLLSLPVFNQISLIWMKIVERSLIKVCGSVDQAKYWGYCQLLFIRTLITFPLGTPVKYGPTIQLELLIEDLAKRILNKIRRADKQ
jgi:hypothetical protein